MEEMKKKNETLSIIIGVISILLIVLFAALAVSLLPFTKQQKEDELSDYVWESTPIDLAEYEAEAEEEHGSNEAEEVKEHDWEEWEDGWDDYEEDSKPASDPYGIYATSEDWVKSVGGYAVERNNKLYSLAYEMPCTVLSEYHSGYQMGKISEDLPAMLYIVDGGDVSDVPTKATNAITQIGDFPTYYVEAGEELRVYSDYLIEELELRQIEFYGYTIPAFNRGTVYSPLRNRVFSALEKTPTNVAVLTMDENPVEDVRKLEYGKSYIFEWYEGTEYHSETYPATCKCYTIMKDNVFTVPVKLTKNGYGVVDLSKLDSGSYMLNYSLPFEYVAK